MQVAVMNAILPVIDLQRGTVVRGVAGERENYKPIQSTLTAGASPAEIATALHDTLGFRDVYVADLDAIEGASPAWVDYEAIASTGLGLWIDAGASEWSIAEAIASRQFGDRGDAGTQEVPRRSE